MTKWTKKLVVGESQLQPAYFTIICEKVGVGVGKETKKGCVNVATTATSKRLGSDFTRIEGGWVGGGKDGENWLCEAEMGKEIAGDTWPLVHEINIEK